MNLYPELTRGKIVYQRYEQLRCSRAQLAVHIEVEELAVPALRGASLRTHRVWQNGSLAGGGAWRHSLEDAIAQADYLVIQHYAAKVSVQDQRVNKLEAVNAQLKAELEALKEQRNYTELG